MVICVPRPFLWLVEDIFIIAPKPSSQSLDASSPDSALQKVSSVAVAGIATEQLVVDVSGAVKTPGVYSMPPDSRLGDALTAAGGVDANLADSTYLSQKVNLASLVTDGQKIYIPFQGEDITLLPLGAASGDIASVGLVSINSGSSAELDTLPGVGPATATKIIDGRPYVSLEDLVTKKAVGQSEFDKIKAKISL